MRIGFDAKRLYNNFTGLGNYSRTLAGNLSVFFPDDEYVLYSPGIKECPETLSFLNNPQFTTVLHKQAPKFWWRARGIRKDLRQDRINLFHGLSHEIPLGIQHSPVRSVVTIHDIIYKTYPDMFTAIDRTIYDFKFRYSCKHADKVIAISESTKNDIIRYFGTPEEKIKVIYQAIDPLFYSRQPDETAKAIVRTYNIPDDFLLYVGSINSRKNLMGIVKAYRHLPPDLRLPLVIVGKGGQYKKEVLEYAAANKLSHLLILIDNLHDVRTLQAFYQQAKIFVFPSFYEGFGLPVTEALLSGTPVITSNVSSLPEAGGRHSWYVAPDDTECIAEGINRILSDNALSQQMAEEGIRFALRQFDHRELTRQVHDLYHSLE